VKVTGESIMTSDILIIREGDGYRLLHGHLHLVNELTRHGEVLVDVKNEGRVKVVRTRQGYFAGVDEPHLPLLQN
jgi:hypothetical protein